MGLKILCSGYLVRYPLGGFSWHHLQYLVGLRRLGHQVVYFEDFGWPNSCYDVALGTMTSDPTYGIEFLKNLLRPHGMDGRWCYLGEDGTTHGMARQQLAQHCRDCDVYINISNINWIAELEQCRRRILVDTDPVFTQIGGFGLGGPFSRYDVLFTYGENIHRPGCTIPDGGARWLPTRQPVVLDLWPVSPGDAGAAFTTVMNWSAYGDRVHEERVYGQKDREFEPFFALPHRTGEPMEIAVNPPAAAQERLAAGGWRIVDPLSASRDPAGYQRYLASSRTEFSVAKHAYVTTRSGWFSDRSACYLASGRPVVVQDTGFSDFLPCGAGLHPYRTAEEAVAALRRVTADYPQQCRAARAVAEEYFDARVVLTGILDAAAGRDAALGSVQSHAGSHS